MPAVNVQTVNVVKAFLNSFPKRKLLIHYSNIFCVDFPFPAILIPAFMA